MMKLTLCLLGVLVAVHGAAPFFRGHHEHLEDGATAGIAFDIDGVIKQGDKTCLEGQIAIRKVMMAQIPWVFLTNGGGGATEEEFARNTEKKLNDPNAELCFPSAENIEKLLPLKGKLAPVSLTWDRAILCYSPWNRTLTDLADKHVVVAGRTNTAELAKKYGFKNAVHIAEYARRDSTIDPFSKAIMAEAPFCSNVYGSECAWDDTRHSCNLPNEPPTQRAEALLVFNDISHIGNFLQVGTDLLMSGSPREKELDSEQIPIYFGATDLLWQSDYPNLRFGLGAHIVALKAVYQARLSALGLTPAQIEARMTDKWVFFGKPEVKAYRFAEDRLNGMAAQLQKKVGAFYMVGDNPNTDIEGAWRTRQDAAKRGSPLWSGVLVRTGVYKDGDDTHHAATIANDVNAAVDWILSQK
eukprot:GILK01001349.1.p1 GENE.GILK01001349.1~~GILK01001349.1.p1  ORF type:complete len:413 (+),score=49.45 GILK01001349.1:56-1294(+)